MLRLLHYVDKKLGRPLEKLLRAFILFLLIIYYLLIFCTLRVEEKGMNKAKILSAQSKNCFVAAWHGRLLMCGIVARRKIGGKLLAFNSPHPNGKMLAILNFFLKIRTVYGAPNKNPRAGMLNALKSFEQNYTLLLTPDGPSGPNQIAKRGVVLMAKISGRPIIPVGFSAKYALTLKSWDCFFLPAPFSRIFVNWGEEIFIPKDCNKQQLEDYRTGLEGTLNHLMQEADQFYGRA